METGEFSVDGLSRKVRDIVGRVQSVMRREKGEDYDPRLIEDSLRVCVANEVDRLEESMLEMFTTPGRREFHELAGILEKNSAASRAAVEVEEMVYLAEEFGDTSLFDGFRPFSKTKMAAMIEYLTGKGHHVYKTSLNKLLFYSDLSFFYLRSHGMSGAVYHNRPFGPVADPAGHILNELITDERVRVVPQTQTLEAATPAANATEALTEDETKVLDWVADTYGHMGASEISSLSHREMAYKYTEPNEPIAYAYGKFFKHLPPKDLLDQ
ncbi:MAG TPA: Panacea domain-containing protein [Pyrinomonadaceae bacterium]|nr:Panacea domain-containing protein [Pyrinomonadaceae bacterium]